MAKRKAPVQLLPQEGLSRAALARYKDKGAGTVLPLDAGRELSEQLVAVRVRHSPDGAIHRDDTPRWMLRFVRLDLPFP